MVGIPDSVPQRGQYDGTIYLSSFGLVCIAAQSLYGKIPYAEFCSPNLIFCTPRVNLRRGSL